MELWVYALPDMTLTGIIEAVDSLRYTLAYSEPGEIEIHSKLPEDLRLMTMPCVVWPKGCPEAYIMEELRSGTQDGLFEWSANGRTLSALLSWRQLYRNWVFKGTEGAIINSMLGEIIKDASNSSTSDVPLNQTFPHFGYQIDKTLGSASYRYDSVPMDLLSGIEEVAAADAIGFYTAWDPFARSALFTLYKGVETNCVFSEEFENISGLDYAYSVRNYANVCVIEGTYDTQIAMAQPNPNVAGDILTQNASSHIILLDVVGDRKLSGYNLRTTSVMWNKSMLDQQSGSVTVSALFPPQTGETIIPRSTILSSMRKAGEQKLTETTLIETLECEINPHSKLYVYGVDYTLGDMVTVRSSRHSLDKRLRLIEIEYELWNGAITTRCTFGDFAPTVSDRLKTMTNRRR